MPRDSVSPRFERARDACLNDKMLNCTLVSASLNLPNSKGDAGYVVGELDVALPHDKVEIYEKTVLKPLPQDQDGKVAVESRNTQADNVGNQVVDLDRRIAQLTNYRDNLTALTKRSDTKADDLIKLESELSKAQSDLDEALASKRDVSASISKERLHVSLTEKPSAFEPVARVWNNAADIVSLSTSAILSVLIAMAPWLAFALCVALLVWIIRRVFRRKKPGA